jgi:hypothetical protein
MCSILKTSNEKERKKKGEEKKKKFGLFEKWLHPVKWQTDRSNTNIHIFNGFTFCEN